MSMVGVAHRFRRSSESIYWFAFLLGLAAAALAWACVLAHIQRTVDGVSAALLPPIALFGLGVADLLGMPVSVSRQTPQGFSRRLDATWLGLVYGVDVGLIVTTQNVTSAIFAAMVLVVAYGGSPWVVLAPYIGSYWTASVSAYAIVGRSRCGVDRLRPDRVRVWQSVSGAVILIAAVGLGTSRMIQ